MGVRTAAAGGIEAFKAFFARMPVDSGMSFVLIQHLDPAYRSSLASIVAGYTKMLIHVAENGAVVGPDQVYVIPPDAILTIQGGRLRLARPAPLAARRTSTPWLQPARTAACASSGTASSRAEISSAAPTAPRRRVPAGSGIGPS